MGTLYVKGNPVTNGAVVEQTLTSGTEIAKVNNVPLYAPSGGGGGIPHVELTQAEYDALTDSEKNNGSVYFLTDSKKDLQKRHHLWWCSA